MEKIKEALAALEKGDVMCEVVAAGLLREVLYTKLSSILGQSGYTLCDETELTKLDYIVGEKLMTIDLEDGREFKIADVPVLREDIANFTVNDEEGGEWYFRTFKYEPLTVGDLHD